MRACRSCSTGKLASISLDFYQGIRCCQLNRSWAWVLLSFLGTVQCWFILIARQAVTSELLDSSTTKIKSSRSRSVWELGISCTSRNKLERLYRITEHDNWPSRRPITNRHSFRAERYCATKGIQVLPGQRSTSEHHLDEGRWMTRGQWTPAPSFASARTARSRCKSSLSFFCCMTTSNQQVS